MPKHGRSLQGSPCSLSQQSLSTWWLWMRHGRKKLKGKISKVEGVESPPLKDCKTPQSSSPSQAAILHKAWELFWVGIQGYLIHKAQASMGTLWVDQLGQGLRCGIAEEEFPLGNRQTRAVFGCFVFPPQECRALTPRPQSPQRLPGFNPPALHTELLHRYGARAVVQIQPGLC